MGVGVYSNAYLLEKERVAREIFMCEILRMENITKVYGALKANDDISFSLQQGEILAIIGENGAGKSTLMKILYGLENATAGKIYLRGKEACIKTPHDAMAHHIGMVQQHFMLLDTCSVAENVVYGCEPRKYKIFFDRKKAIEETGKLSEKYGLQIDPELKVGDCPVGLQQRVEILKVLYQNAEILIFDEPSAVLTPQEVAELLKTIRHLSDMGKSIIIITHKLKEVMQVADRVLVLRRGKYIKEVNTCDTDMEELSCLMVGKSIVHREVEPQEAGRCILQVKDLVLKDKRAGRNILDGLSLEVKEGEIVGIAGVSGNGQSELIKVLTGIEKADAGEISVNGNAVMKKSVREIRDAGMACIPEDRYLSGCAKAADLVETAIMAHHQKSRFSRKGLLRYREAKDFTRTLLEEYDVRNSGLSQKAEELSGGNIQKLIVAREIEENTPCLIAAEPTRGVDIGAMKYIHEQLLNRRSKGGGILLISSELTEILALSDRIYVMYEGKIAAEFGRKDADEEKIGMYMMGGHTDEME